MKSQVPTEDQINSVISLYSSGHLEAAIDAVEILIQDNPYEAKLQNISGICNAALGKLDKAVLCYKEALKIKPNYVEALNNLGITFHNLGQLDEAVKIYEQVIAIKPDYAEALNNLGITLMELDHLEEAVKSYEKALAINPNYSTAFNNLSITLKELGEPDSAIKSYNRIIDINPDIAEAHNNLGNALHDIGYLEDAIKSYEKALAINPDFAQAHNNRGFTRQELDQKGPPLNKWIGESKKKQKIEELIKLLKPIKTNHNLIRVGGDTDGGYLIPNDIENISACFSPGVSDNANFENDLTKKGIKCFLADYSVEKPPKNNPLFDFEKKYLSDINNEMNLTLKNWVELKAPNQYDFILQMDIEGSEYPVIANTPEEVLNKFRILVIEFHGLDSLFDRVKFNSIELSFKKILKNFEVVHIHPNNCIKPTICNGIIIPPYMEFTFLRKDRITTKSNCTIFPHKLDRPNIASFNDFSLPKCWF